MVTFEMEDIIPTMYNGKKYFFVNGRMIIDADELPKFINRADMGNMIEVEACQK